MSFERIFLIIIAIITILTFFMVIYMSSKVDKLKPLLEFVELVNSYKDTPL